MRGEPTFRADFSLRIDEASVEIKSGLPVSAVDDERALCGDGDGTAGNILLSIRDRDRLTPLAALERLHEELIGEPRLVIRLEILGLLLEGRGFQLAAGLTVLIADVSDPERAVGAIGGGWHVLLCLRTCYRLGRGDEPGNGGPIEKRLRLAGPNLVQVHALFVAIDENGKRGLGIHVLQVQHDADGSNRLQLRDRGLSLGGTHRRPRFRLPGNGPAVFAVAHLDLVILAKTIAFLVHQPRAGDGRLAGPIGRLEILLAEFQQNRHARLARRSLLRPIKQREGTRRLQAKNDSDGEERLNPTRERIRFMADS